jgi:hypothetical protein
MGNHVDKWDFARTLQFAGKVISILLVTSLPACRETLRAEKNIRYLDFIHSQLHTSLLIHKHKKSSSITQLFIII